MGVSGSGKSTVGAMLARSLGWPFAEGDAMHPASNIEKMRSGHPLGDDDRRPWLAAVAEWIDERLDGNQNGVITCSALKRSYRAALNRRGSGVVFVFLAGRKAAMEARLAARSGHFMPASLVESQFSDLEAPASDEPAIRMDAALPPEIIANQVLGELGLNRPRRGTDR
jgi:gluconokinase